MTARELGELIGGHKFRYANEADVQAAIAGLLIDAELDHDGEVPLNDRDRIDFLVGDVGVEVKIKGSPSAVLAQLTRYAESPRIAGLVLVTDRMQVASLVGPAILGKPIHVVRLYGGLR